MYILRSVKYFSTLLFALLFYASAASAYGASAGDAGSDRLRIAGSSTVFPFISIVAEHYADKNNKKSPVVESIGSGTGMKLFCSIDGGLHIATSSRVISKREKENCNKAGISFLELKIGYDAITIVGSSNSQMFDLDLPTIFFMIAEEIPSGNSSSLSQNNNIFWSDIKTSYPNRKIEIFGPPSTSGTRDSLIEMVMLKGLKKLGLVGSKKYLHSVASNFRKDGAYISVGENDNIIIRKLSLGGNSHALGVMGFSYYEQNSDTLNAYSINGVKPTFESISDGSYPLVRPLYIYVNKSFLYKDQLGIKKFLREMFSDDAIGYYGYLIDKGLIPISDKEKALYMNYISN